MKILIFYTPRSKSTFLQEILSKKFNLEAVVDPFVYSKKKNNNYSEFPEIVKRINDSQNICVKISSIDFLDSRNRKILDYYKDINYHSFDKIIFTTRNDLLSAALSACHMIPNDEGTWHSTKERKNPGRRFSAELSRVLWMLRGYRVFELIKSYIKNNFKNNWYEYEYNTLEQDVKKDFDLNDDSFDTNLIANEIDYRTLATNIEQVELFIKNNYEVIQQSMDLESIHSIFWKIQ